MREAGAGPGSQRSPRSARLGFVAFCASASALVAAACEEPRPDVADPASWPPPPAPPPTMHIGPHGRPPEFPHARKRLLTPEDSRLVDSESDRWLVEHVLPPAPPLSRRHLEGVFPPRWKPGATWTTVILTRDHLSGVPRLPDAGPDPYRAVLHTYTVVRVPDEPTGEYEIEIRRAHQGEQRAALFLARFWAMDFSLSFLRWRVLGENDWRSVEEGVGNGPYPFFQGHDRQLDYYHPILAWPVAEDARRNPTFYWYLETDWDGAERPYSIAQVTTPTEDGLRYLLRRATPSGVEDASCTWRRGDPWWSTAWYYGTVGYLLSEEDLARVREASWFNWHRWLCDRDPGLCQNGK